MSSDFQTIFPIMGLLFAIIVFLSIVARGPIRRMVNLTAEMLAVFALLSFILMGGIAGYVWGGSLRVSLGPGFLRDQLPAIAALLSALLSYVVAALVLSVVFLLTEIAENTRKTVKFFEHLVRPRPEPAGDDA
jgi:hypothetical protein